MAITVNNVQEQANSATLSSYTPTSVTDSCLIVVVQCEDVSSDEDITGCDFGATAMTQAIDGDHTVGSHTNCLRVFYLQNPGTSAANITVQGGQTDRMGIGAFTAGDIEQSGSPLDGAGDTDAMTSGTTGSTSVTPTVTDTLKVIGLSHDSPSGGLTPPTGMTEQVDLTCGSSRLGVSTEVVTDTTAQNDTYTGGTMARSAMATVLFKQAGAGGGSSVAPLAHHHRIQMVA